MRTVGTGAVARWFWPIIGGILLWRTGKSMTEMGLATTIIWRQCQIRSFHFHSIPPTAPIPHSWQSGCRSEIVPGFRSPTRMSMPSADRPQDASLTAALRVASPLPQLPHCGSFLHFLFERSRQPLDLRVSCKIGVASGLDGPRPAAATRLFVLLALGKIFRFPTFFSLSQIGKILQARSAGLVG